MGFNSQPSNGRERFNRQKRLFVPSTFKTECSSKSSEVFPVLFQLIFKGLWLSPVSKLEKLQFHGGSKSLSLDITR